MTNDEQYRQRLVRDFSVRASCRLHGIYDPRICTDKCTETKGKLLRPSTDSFGPMVPVLGIHIVRIGSLIEILLGDKPRRESILNLLNLLVQFFLGGC
jgi:hypothetical protein